MRIADQSLNRLNVIKAIRRHEPLSRSDLPGLTGLSPATITEVVAALVKRGLLSETKEQGKRRTGRPRTFLRINAGGAIVVGVSLSQHGTLNASFVDLAGHDLFSIEIPLRYPTDLAGFAECIASALEQAIAASPFERDDLSRLGISIPALIDSQRGSVHQIGMFAAGSVPFAEIIGSRIALSVTIENDTTCMARAEHWFGRAQELQSFSLVFVDYTVGSASYLDGLPRFGCNGLNSELGHTKTAFGPEAPQCFCGQRGCLLTFSSIYGMVRQWGRLPELTRESILLLRSTFQEFLDKAASGDCEALAILDMAATHLGISIANHVNATDPGTVLLLTSSRQMQSLLSERICTVVEQNVMAGILPKTKLIFGVADPNWRRRGAAALALEKIYLEYDVRITKTMESSTGSRPVDLRESLGLYPTSRP